MKEIISVLLLTSLSLYSVTFSPLAVSLRTTLASPRANETPHLAIQVPVEENKGLVEAEKAKIVADVTTEEKKVGKVTTRIGLDGKSKPVKHVKGNTTEERVKALLNANGVGETYDLWVKYGEEYKVDYVFAISVAWSETHLGRALATKSNLTNVGNNDRGDRVEMSGYEHGIKAFYQTMNNKYLGGYDQIKYLSGEGRKRAGLNGCVGRGDYCFATSTTHWESNVVNMMSALYDKQIDGSYFFRK